MKRTLTLAVKKEYFDAIRSGEKTEEYRLFNSYWYRRLTMVPAGYEPNEETAEVYFRSFDKIVITLGYPKKDDTSRRLEFPFNYWVIKTITHPHFGSEPVKVFAISLKGTK